MKKLYKLVTLLMIFGLFTACSSSDDDIPAKITIPKSEFTVGAEANSEAVATFTINVAWETSVISYVGDAKDWLTVTPSGKAGTDQTITMKAAENPAEIERKASFNINYGGKQHKLTVTQLAKSINPTITISTSEFTVNGEAGSEAVATFSINVDWETSVISYVGDAKDWLTIAPIEGKAGTDQTITMKAAENLAVTERTASFNINYGGKEHKLTVTQAFQEATDITADFDAKFAAELQKRGYILDATKILSSEVRTITTIDVAGEFMAEGDLTSLAGIEYFKSLTELYCSFNQLASLDVSKNSALAILECSRNQLTTLDVSKNVALTDLRYGNNQLPVLDVSENIALTFLDCSFNQRTTLDISKNIALTNLHCYDNELTILDVSNNTALTDLWCGANQLEALDVSKNRALTYLSCFGNQLTALDLSNSTALKDLICSENQLAVLDLSKNIALKDLLCDDNQLTVLDLSKNIALTDLWCVSNQLSALDLSNNTALIDLNCSRNKLTSLNLSKSTALVEVRCYNNELTALDVKNNIALKILYCNANKLTSMDISKNTALGKFYYHNNPGSENKFVVKAWFDNNNVPSGFPAANYSWKLDGQTITVDYQKVI